MSDANRVQLSYIKESTYGTTPSGALKILRMTGESLQLATDTTVSQELRSDRQTGDFIRTGLRTNGDINFEFSVAAYDELIEYALFSAPLTTAGSSVPWTGNTVTIATSGVNFTITRTVGSTDFSSMTNHTNGKWIKLTGFASSSNNTWVKILGTPTASVLTVTGAVLVPVVGATVISSVVQAEMVAGTTTSSMTIERAYTDLASTFAIYNGVLINTMSLSGTANGIITGSFGILGKNEANAAATVGTGYTASATAPVMNGIDNLELVLENNAAQSLFSFTFQLQNNLRERLQMGTLGPISIATGQIGISGTIVLYFTAAAAAAALEYQNFSTSSMMIRLVGATGGRYIIDMPAVKFSGATRSAGGINQDVFLTMNYTGFLNSTSLDSLRIIKAA